MDETSTPSANTPEQPVSTPATPPTLPTPQVEMPASVPMQPSSSAQFSAQPAMSTEKYPVSVQIEYVEKGSRILAFSSLTLFIKAIILIPHLFVLYFLSLFAGIIMILANLVTLFTGKRNKGLTNLLVGYIRWSTRMTAYFYGLTDVYPPFTFED